MSPLNGPHPLHLILVTDDDSCDPGNFTIRFLSFALSLSILVSRSRGFCGPSPSSRQVDELISVGGLMKINDEAHARMRVVCARGVRARVCE